MYEPYPDDPKEKRPLTAPFNELPDRNDYPDYYQLIQKPVCLNEIADKINRKAYQDAKEFYQDFKLLCNNCRQYNEDSSMLYKDANTIEVRFDRVTEKHNP